MTVSEAVGLESAHSFELSELVMCVITNTDNLYRSCKDQNSSREGTNYKIISLLTTAFNV